MKFPNSIDAIPKNPLRLEQGNYNFLKKLSKYSCMKKMIENKDVFLQSHVAVTSGYEHNKSISKMFFVFYELLRILFIILCIAFIKFT